MDKDIRFTGYTAVPSDYESTDGELTQCHNLLNEDGAYHSLLAPKVLVNLGENYKVIFIHKTTAFTHYIVHNTSTHGLYWMEENASSVNTTSAYRLGSFYNLNHVDSVGNTLLVFCNDKIEYYLWKVDSYTSLGDHLPSPELSFGLRGKPRLWSKTKEAETDSNTRGTFSISFNKISKGSIYEEWTEENQNRITSQIMAKVNKFLSTETIQKGRFALPFFVRYALRLYDGSLVCHSAPILMNPSTKAAPIVLWKRVSGKDGYTDAECDIMLVSAGLDYRLVIDGEADGSILKRDWTDIVKSVDVFISKPIYTYDQGGVCKSFNDTDNFKSKFIGAIDFDGFTSSVTENKILLPITLDGVQQTTSSASGKNSTIGTSYVEWSYVQLYTMFFSSDRTYPSTTINLPEFSDDKNKDTLSNTQNFYFLHSIALDELSTTERKDIKIDDEYLQSLTSREVMTDDYLTHDRLRAQFSQNFNNRLNLSGVKRSLFRGFSVKSMFAHCTSAFYRYMAKDNTISLSFTNEHTSEVRVYVFIKENGRIYQVQDDLYWGESYPAPFLSIEYYKSEEDEKNKKTSILKTSRGCFVFYPNPNAYMMVFSEPSQSYKVDLKAHDFLNGAYAVLDYDLERLPQTFTWPEITYDKAMTMDDVNNNVVDIPNKIYTSEINNPFFFPVTGINTIGTGRILGISTAAKALSQGQFGQFPLYAFTDEGVWALEVNSSGGYSAKQPITRDVCISSDSITQIDSAVLFATDRGIMEISGSTTTCITDIINGPDFFDIASLPGLTKLYPDGLPKIDCTFAEYRKGARMAYDYINQRIIVFNENKNYAYVFSMRSKLWGIMSSSLISAVNSYPDAYAMAKIGTDNCLVDLSRSTDTHARGLLVTRPIKLDAGSMLKTFDTVFLRGLFGKGKVQVVLYGSRDNIRWHLVHSAKEHYLRGFRGSPYKYFRIVAITDLAVGETLLGASVAYTPRLTNQMR